MADILSVLNNPIYPGYRVPRIAGWEELKKFAMARNTEGIFLDANPENNWIYMKKVDADGNELCARYKYEPDPVEEFEPGAYVRKSDLKAMKEEIFDGIDSRFEQLSKQLAQYSAEPATGSTGHSVPGTAAGKADRRSS